MSIIKSTKYLFLRGLKLIAESDLGKEKASAGVMRGGNAGAVLEKRGDNYMVVGNGLREAYIRTFLGFSEDFKIDKRLMFLGGHANEDIWTKVLQKACEEESLTFKREEELGLSWEIEGVKCTGRPDYVFFNKEGEPVRGLEFKQASSIWTARDVLINNQPKLSHLIQAANYSLRMNIPYELWYSNYVNHTSPGYYLKPPLSGEPRSEYFDYIPVLHYTNRNGKQSFKKVKIPKIHAESDPSFLKNTYGVTGFEFKNVKPFIYGFSIRWNQGYLEWASLYGFAPRYVRTPITPESINEFYVQLATMADRKHLPPTVTNMKADGQIDDGFNLEDYSLFADINENVQNFDEWEDAIKQRIIELGADIPSDDN